MRPNLARWLIGSVSSLLLLCDQGSVFAQEVNADKLKDWSLALDHLEARSGTHSDSVFADATGELAIGSGAVAAKFSSDIPVGDPDLVAEVQLRYSQRLVSGIDAIAGIRADVAAGVFDPYPYIGIGVTPLEVLEAEFLFFVPVGGELIGRAEFVVTLPVGRHLTFEKKAELNWSVQEPEHGLGAIDTLDLSGRVMWGAEYPLSPYIGLLHARVIGRAAALAEMDGNDPHVTSLILGFRLAL